MKQKTLGPTEDVREVWAALYSVLDELGQSCSASSHDVPEVAGARIDAKEEADDSIKEKEESSGRLEAVCEVVLNWGRSLVDTNLESIQFLLRRIEATSNKWSCLSPALARVMASLQADIKAQYSGRMVLHTHEVLDA